MNALRQEPSLAEMLEDPAIQALMRRDGIHRDDLETLLRVARASRRWTGQIRIPPALLAQRDRPAA